MSLFFEISIILLGVLSPTFWVAKWLKSTFQKNVIIRVLNWSYFLIAVTCVIGIGSYHLVGRTIPNIISNPWVSWLWSVLLLSRCTEILYAFLIDAYDKVTYSKEESKSSVQPDKPWYKLEIDASKIEIHHRLVFALRSYIELIINFSILYTLVPYNYWKNLDTSLDIISALYFSGVTITTLGYGDISPIHWYPQFLSVYEVLCGFTLLVVCFAVYLSRK